MRRDMTRIAYDDKTAAAFKAVREVPQDTQPGTPNFVA
jgi:hypothetical protein